MGLPVYGVIDLWKNRDGTPSKLATGRWAEGQGRPQDVGKRWRGWYVADDGKQHTRRFRIEVEAEAWANKERGKVHTNQWVSPTVGGDTVPSRVLPIPDTFLPFSDTGSRSESR
jgi:hypothetical protein